MQSGPTEIPPPPAVRRRDPEVSAATDWHVIDLCCGLGGLSLAARELGCKIVAGVDVSAQALESFAANFPKAKAITGSVTDRSVRAKLVTLAKAARPLIVVSGPPCQGFSPAGRRQKRDPRNRVLGAVARTIVELQPDAAVIENVAALMTPRHGPRLRRFKKILMDAGYHLTIRELNAKDFGTPQDRRRMICLATSVPLESERVTQLLEKQHAAPSTAKQALAGLAAPPVYRGPGREVAAAVPNHVAMRHSERVKKKIARVKQGVGPMSYRRLDPKKPSRTLVSGNRAPPAHYSQARSITTREAARLQGLPDTFIIKGRFANQMLHVTNAVPRQLAQAAIKTLLMGLGEQHDGVP